MWEKAILKMIGDWNTPGLYLNNKGDSVWWKSVCNSGLACEHPTCTANVAHSVYNGPVFYRSIFTGGVTLGRQHELEDNLSYIQ